jgi:hypothetical protein
MLTDERIDEIAGPGPDYFDRRVFARAIEAEAIAPLLARIAELEADAKRWRHFWSCGLPVTFMGTEYHSKQECDASIDEAMKEQP